MLRFHWDANLQTPVGVVRDGAVRSIKMPYESVTDWKTTYSDLDTRSPIKLFWLSLQPYCVEDLWFLPAKSHRPVLHLDRDDDGSTRGRNETHHLPLDI